ncbi:hypothetical protein [Leptolyngbya ectocarpi]|uniref:hypothetical protein n=1 Tax=Leptolyngbya ectocarpi TaxID=1202 RepID=UPI001D13BD10|nr:hypothetical protein [Leptolyngbya ectocarpi]
MQITIKELLQRNYAEPNDWSRPLPTGQPNEVMAILTRKVRVGSCCDRAIQRDR